MARQTARRRGRRLCPEPARPHPDFIPVLGYLDDLIVVPLGITLVLKLIPDEVMKDCRERALAETARPTSRAGAIVVVAIWFVLAVLLGLWIVELLRRMSQFVVLAAVAPVQAT